MVPTGDRVCIGKPDTVSGHLLPKHCSDPRPDERSSRTRARVTGPHLWAARLISWCPRPSAWSVGERRAP